jgi:hypothetical protein
LSNLGVQLLDLAFARLLALPPDTRLKGPGRLFQKHYTWAKDGEVIIQVTGVGPSGKTFIPQ